MRNFTEVELRLKDAESSLKSAERNFPLEDYRVVVQSAQLCIELSAKAVIAYFEEPLWTHRPSEQLVGIVEDHRGKISETFGEEIIRVWLKSVEEWSLQADKTGSPVLAHRCQGKPRLPQVLATLK
ncbi:MAG: HEPN domain-containing protein [Anaerolineae bacterium]